MPPVPSRQLQPCALGQSRHDADLARPVLQADICTVTACAAAKCILAAGTSHAWPVQILGMLHLIIFNQGCGGSLPSNI